MNKIIKHKKLTVLIVDCDEEVSQSIYNLLEMNNIDCIIAKNFDESKSIIDNMSIHLAIIDYQLGDKRHGTDVIAYLKSKKPYIPIIMSSLDDNEIIRIGSIEAGANLFLLKPFNFSELIKLIKNMLSIVSVYENLEDAENMIIALVRAVELRDTYVEGHSQRVAQLSLNLYDYIEIDDLDDRNALYAGCLLHDIGKLGIPDNILKSKNPLTKEERLQIEEHPLKGYEVCKDLTRLGKALKVIRSHHEKLDGSGYPDNLSRDDIPCIVRIAAISDIYDALTSLRLYRKKNSMSESFAIIQKEVDNEKVDGYLFKYFKKMLLENEY